MLKVEWIKDLKVGDTVIVAWYYYDYACKIATVDRVTPSGRVVVGTITFNPDGYSRGEKGYFLEQATEEKLKEIKEKEIVQEALYEMRNCRELIYDQAIKILKVLGE